jgi:uncharacterized membrane protein
MNELTDQKEFVPMREGPFRTCIQLPKTQPVDQRELPKLYDDLRIDLKEADLANRRHRITIRQTGVILGVLAIYLVLAAMIFPRTRFFRRPIHVTWGGSAITLLETRTLDRLPQGIREALEEGRFTHAREALGTMYFGGEVLPGSEHFAWPVYLFTLERTKSPLSAELTENLLDENPEMIAARFYRALYHIRNIERSRLNPAWHDRRTQRLIEEMNSNLRSALSDLNRISNQIVPMGNRRTSAQSEMLRLTYHHIAEVNYLLWLHEPGRPRGITKELEDAFRYLNLADPDRNHAESVELRKHMARSFDELLDWGIGFFRKTHMLFGEDRDVENLRAFVDELKDDLDRSRRIQ